MLMESTFIVTMSMKLSYTAQKMKFSIKDFFSKCVQICSCGFGHITEETVNGKLPFLCSDSYYGQWAQ